MRYELTDFEWAAIRPFLPNKARGNPRIDAGPATPAVKVNKGFKLPVAV
jgi:transposase